MASSNVNNDFADLKKHLTSEVSNQRFYYCQTLDANGGNFSCIVSWSQLWEAGLSYGKLISAIHGSQLYIVLSCIGSWSHLYIVLSYAGIWTQLYEGISLFNVYIYSVYGTIV